MFIEYCVWTPYCVQSEIIIVGSKKKKVLKKKNHWELIMSTVWKMFDFAFLYTSIFNKGVGGFCL